jgi:stearoyl-CoA desaturase (delta-9 desaturase)
MTTLASSTKSTEPTTSADAPEVERKGTGEQVALALFIGIPFLALLAAIPVAWGWGLGWRDIVIAVVMYAIAGHGVTVGFHRHFTHGSFKAKRGLRIALAVAGSLAIEGPVIRWVADHRRHHAFSDREGDPHSPWRYGETIPALAKGLWWAHTGWLFDVEQTPRTKYAPDLLADEDIRKVDRAFPALVVVSLLLPPLIGGLWSMSWQGALTAFFWGSLVRVALLHHVTWSINSICHTIGERPFKSRDKSGNVW